ncbi:MAG: restriction endonuclease subunit S [Deltaproteobacteria bacterium]|jgi:type I restriction enzyme S subunit|nr:restriction endonuclease subunit S [Deltaproteobacteria bacterium]
MNSRISNLATEIRDVYIPNKEDDLPYIGLEHVEQESLHLSSIGSSQEVKSHKFRFKSGDILFGTLRPYFRKVIVAPCNGICSTEFCVVRANDPKDQQFVFYGMAQPQFIKYATTNSKGARPRTKWKLFSDFELPQFLPSQRRDIGDILSAYDDLIENNRQRIQLLEQAARLLYREWFVYLCFPGHEHVSITDGVPEGWEKVPILSFCTVGRGGSPRPIKNYTDGTVPWFKIGDATASGSPFVFSTKELLIEDGVKKSVLLPTQELVLSNSATCGIPYFTGVSGCIHDGWLYFKELTRVSKWFLYCCLFAKQREILMGIGEGATQKNLNTDYVGRQLVLLPKEQVFLTNFTEAVEPFFDQIFTLAQVNISLSEARDLLLPRLMNGEVVV